ncbi:hypothetical protein CMV_024660, partial [Castanea mollissima]
AFLQGLIDEKRSMEEKGNTMIDHLLSLQKSQPEYYTDQIIKGLIQGLLSAGTKTSAITLEARPIIAKILSMSEDEF